MKRLYLFIGIFLFAAQVFGADSVNTGWFGSVAIKGYDPVAYFKENKAVKGSDDLEFEWQDATWRFSSEINRQDFAANPEKYAPQFGGYCAFAVAKNSLAGIEPEQFTIVGDKLYLNYSAKIQKQWLEQRDDFIKQANANWPKVLED